MLPADQQDAPPSKNQTTLCEQDNCVLMLIDVQTGQTASMPLKVLARLQRNIGLLIKASTALQIPVLASEQKPVFLRPGGEFSARPGRHEAQADYYLWNGGAYQCVADGHGVTGRGLSGVCGRRCGLLPSQRKL